MAIAVAFAFGFGLTVTLVIVGALFVSLPVMWLWNAFVPAVFGLHSLTWAQALWLSLLCGLLFRTGATIRREAE